MNLHHYTSMHIVQYGKNVIDQLINRSTAGCVFMPLIPNRLTFILYHPALEHSSTSSENKLKQWSKHYKIYSLCFFIDEWYTFTFSYLRFYVIYFLL